MGKAIARIYLKNFEHNIELIRKITNNKKICLAIKANAYGHGAVQIAKKACELDVDFLSVATVDEGRELRDEGIVKPILLLSLCTKSEISDLVRYDLTPLVSDIEWIDMLSNEVEVQSKKMYPIHIKIDTGMIRHGVKTEDALELYQYIVSKNNLKIEGTCTHFAVSDSLQEDDIQYTKLQLAMFNNLVLGLRQKGIDTGLLHCAASGGILLHEDSHFDMVRPGILTYGYYPDKTLQNARKIYDWNFKPVMELVSYVTSIKEIDSDISVSYGRTWISKNKTKVATIGIGYGDGYNRLLSNLGKVTINNIQYSIIGRVCMDQCVIEIDSKVKRWDEAILFGPNEYSQSATDIANCTNTIPYEVLSLITSRVKRVYV